jgi:MFS family permease
VVGRLVFTAQWTPSVLGVVRAAQIAGLLYVWRNIVQVATSYPVGAFADRYGPSRALIIGYMLGVLTAVLTALAFAFNMGSVTVLAAIFFVGGLYVAVQEALESAVTASMVDADRLATSYGALGVVNGTAKFISSAAVGVLWTAASPVFGFGAAAGLMAAGTIALIRTR